MYNEMLFRFMKALYNEMLFIGFKFILFNVWLLMADLHFHVLNQWLADLALLCLFQEYFSHIRMMLG